ncbi:methylenetetrahydrofolate reductase C-terminal domain-containing protein [Chloroflexota bacterium]
MERTNKSEKILVISSTPELADIIRRAVGSSLEVTCASDQQEGLEKARKDMPNMIALGYIDPAGSAFQLHRKLQEGWITKNIPLLLVDLYPHDYSRRVLSKEEGLQIEADEYIPLSTGDKEDAASRLTEPIARLTERVSTRLREKANILKEAILNPDTFCITWEQIPGRGAFEIQQEELIENVRRAVGKGRIHAVSVTDNPGGNPAISTEMLCTEIKKLGIEPLAHLAFRDKNRNQSESLLYGLAALGVRNLLLLTGDYPSSGGFQGRAKPVFDLDSVHGLQLVEMMNQGMEHEAMRRKTILAPTDFFAGAAVSPFKQLESEVMGQYYKLKKKIEAGAKFIITQVGYDARKLHELLQWLKINGYNIPVLANIYVLPLGTAKVMNAYQIPGCVVTNKLVEEIAGEAKAIDKGRSARLTRAAKTYALAKGMGLAGAHIGGHGISHEMVEEIIEKGEELVPRCQELVSEFDYPQENGFYLFEKDPKTGLNLDTPTPRTGKRKRSLIYELSRFAHATLFTPESSIFKAMLPVTKLVDSSQVLRPAFESFEYLTKVALFSCMNCGDCSLVDVAFLCPMSQCPKNQRNGPCGGSFEGWCEVYPEKQCIWVRAYQRLRTHGEESKIGDCIVPPCNWELTGTSSWLNFYLGRDHSAKRLGIELSSAKNSLEGKNPAKKAR